MWSQISKPSNQHLTACTNTWKMNLFQKFGKATEKKIRGNWFSAEGSNRIRGGGGGGGGGGGVCSAPSAHIFCKDRQALGIEEVTLVSDTTKWCQLGSYIYSGAIQCKESAKSEKVKMHTRRTVKKKHTVLIWNENTRPSSRPNFFHLNYVQCP